MCEEISLLCAHICLMPSFHADKPIPVECRVISICIHYFYTGYSQAVLCYYKNRYYLKIIAKRKKTTFFSYYSALRCVCKLFSWSKKFNNIKYILNIFYKNKRPNQKSKI